MVPSLSWSTPSSIATIEKKKKKKISNRSKKKKPISLKNHPISLIFRPISLKFLPQNPQKAALSTNTTYASRMLSSRSWSTASSIATIPGTVAAPSGVSVAPSIWCGFAPWASSSFTQSREPARTWGGVHEKKTPITGGKHRKTGEKRAKNERKPSKNEQKPSKNEEKINNIEQK
jgi:hypothetical protein